uniref:Uncharacterized protein n=1 Tax=Rangifer tarandus platyrhynchus TaxID=3082113 RepID=A0ACB0F7F3_RANTA|nr:unnamed protein product [Rangifer tarandus platyrhynchus]
MAAAATGAREGAATGPGGGAGAAFSRARRQASEARRPGFPSGSPRPPRWRPRRGPVQAWSSDLQPRPWTRAAR